MVDYNLAKQVVRGDYVFTPIQNAFNHKIAYWISKKDHTIALYAFTIYDKSDIDEMLSDKTLDSYIRYYESVLTCLANGNEKTA